MGFADLQGAFFDAYRRRDYTHCFTLVDDYIETAGGEDLGNALSLKASLIIVVDQRRAAEGLSLVELALEHADASPSLITRCLTNALGFCYLIGDVTRAQQYESRWRYLLERHPNAPEVQIGLFRLHWNVGLIAQLRGEHAAAYWHFVQGIASLQMYGSGEGTNQTRFLFCLHLLVANACLHMRRGPEAAEALDEAKTLIATATDQIEYAIHRAKLLRYSGRFNDAQQCLRALPELSTADWSPELRAQYHLVTALLASDLGDLRGYHGHLNHAHQQAEDHSLEYILCEIQRAQRTPVHLEVIER